MANSRGFQQLGARWWATDFGFARQLNQNNGAGEYLQAEKGHRALWDILTTLDPVNLKLALDYFELPADTIDYIKWMYARVVYQQQADLPATTDQYDVVNHWDLYNLYQGSAREAQRILVYDTGRVTDQDGNVLLEGYSSEE